MHAFDAAIAKCHIGFILGIDYYNTVTWFVLNSISKFLILGSFRPLFETVFYKSVMKPMNVCHHILLLLELHRNWGFNLLSHTQKDPNTTDKPIYWWRIMSTKDNFHDDDNKLDKRNARQYSALVYYMITQTDNRKIMWDMILNLTFAGG